MGRGGGGRGKGGGGGEGGRGKQSRPAVSLEKPPRRGRAETRHRALRAWLLDGLAADFRPESPRAPRFLGDGLVRGPRLRDLVHGPRGLRALRQVTPDQLRHSERRRRSRRRQRIHPQDLGRGQAARVRHLLGRATGGALRASAPRARRAPCARRFRVDGRGQPDARRAKEKTSRVLGEEPPADRPRLRAQHLRARSSGHGRQGDHRGFRRRHRRAGRFGADRDLRGHVLEAADRRSGENHRSHDHHARAMGRHRGDRRPDRILQAPAQPRQAVRGHGRHLARELPAKELPDRLSHPALVLLAAGTGVPGVETSRKSGDDGRRSKGDRGMRSIGAVLAFSLWAFSALAQDYPTRPVRIVIPLSPGGTTDVPGRIIAQKLSETLGQQFFVENRAGAGGTIGSDYVAKSRPDGYTLLLTASAFVIAPHVYKTMPYDTLADFAPVIRIATGPYVLVVHPSLGVNSVKELIALAKKEPGKIDFASSGNGGAQHLVTELFMYMAGIELNHVPYKGSGPAQQDLMSGIVKVSFVGTPIAIPHMKSGRLKALGVSTAKRSPEIPEVPTIAEAGVPGYQAIVWIRMLAPAGNPPRTLSKLHPRGRPPRCGRREKKTPH